MKLLTNFTQREIAGVALINQKKLAIDGLSILKRLGKSEGPALEAQGQVEYLIDQLTGINIGERDVKEWEITNSTAPQLRCALANWARQALKKSESAAQLKLTTDISKQEKAAQQLLDQLNEQLSLPMQKIDDLVEELDGKKADEEDDEGEMVSGKDAAADPGAATEGRQSGKGRKWNRTIPKVKK